MGGTRVGCFRVAAVTLLAADTVERVLGCDPLIDVCRHRLSPGEAQMAGRAFVPGDSPRDWFLRQEHHRQKRREHGRHRHQAICRAHVEYRTKPASVEQQPALGTFRIYATEVSLPTVHRSSPEIRR